MKKLLSIILSISIFLAVIPFGTFTVSAETTSGSCDYNNVTWKYDTETATLTVFGTGAMLDYDSALYNGDYFTTAPWKSFHEKIKIVIIESGVTSIGNYAFYRCEQLTSVIINNTVTSIGDFAFSSSHEITNITIPDSVATIGSYSFDGCNKLKSVIIPDSVTSLGKKAFWRCTGLDSITIHDNILVDESAFDNCRINKLIISSGSKTIKSNMIVCKSTIKSVIIPDSVTSIGEKAFADCTMLTNITIPNSITSIGNRAFNGCTGLKSAGPIGGGYNVEFGWTDEFPSGAFSYCTGLSSVVIPDSIKSIGLGAFAGCDNLKSITIPDSVTEIHGSAFTGCGLESITITNGVTSIGDYAFTCCYSLKSVTIADSVISIGKSAFQQCTKLTSITIPDSVTSIGNAAFFMCTELKSAKMSNGMTSISGYMFRDCTALTSITIPKSVNYIGIYAFDSCKNLRTVYYKGTVKQRSEIYIASTGNSYFINATWYHINCNHNETKIINYRSASCSNAGYTGDVYCCDCDRIIGDGVAIPAIGYHNYTTSVTSPSCTAQGYTTHTCTRCGDSYIDNYVYMPCGENCGFIISDNTLYIHGNGDTDNYKTQTFVPWYDYAYSITEIIIDEGITKIGNYAFYCLNNLKSIKSKNSNLAFGKYAINSTNADIIVFAENGGILETYCAENGITYIDPTIMPELETVTANSITVKAVDGYEYSINGIIWKITNTFSALSPASEYNIYARYSDTADMFDTVGTPLIVTTLKSTVVAPAAPDYQSHTDNSVTLAPNTLYEYSIDGVNWQKSNVFTELSKNTIYRFYQRVAEIETEYASEPSAALIIAIPDKPVILKSGYENIIVKKIEGFEYCLDDMVWQDSNSFDMLIDNTEYYIYQRLKAVDGEKIYQITSDYTAVITDNSIIRNHTPGDINNDGKVNNKDLTRLFKYRSDWDVAVNEAALDVNGDGSVNNKDLLRLFKYLSGWNVQIF